MLPHHVETIERVRAHFEADPDVRAVMLGGSLAHGFGRPGSDVDIQIVIGERDHAGRLEISALTFFSRELATYEGGYVDGKYTTAEFIGQVGQNGSEPARFAYADARLIFSRDENIGDLIVSVHARQRAQLDDGADAGRRSVSRACRSGSRAPWTIAFTGSP